MSAGVGRHGSMKPGGRRAGLVECRSTGFTTPGHARGRRSLGRQSPSIRGGLNVLGTHTQLAQYPQRYRARDPIRESVGSIGAALRSNGPGPIIRRWNQSAASRIGETSPIPSLPSPPCLAG
jgi:hypothetical protein